MENKNFKGRVILKHDTTAKWAAAKEFVPLLGEIIIYEDQIYREEDGYIEPMLKVGDGVNKVGDLPFMNATINKELHDHITNELVHISSADRAYWSHKIDCEDTVEEETLIFFR